MANAAAERWPSTADQGGRVTITDVAKAAGVSVATVSKVVNGRYGVAPATAARVFEVVEQLGYESSLVARSLRRRRTNVIGVLVAEFEPFSTELLKGISQAIEGTGYELLAYSGGSADGNRVGWERRSVSRLGGTLIDGAVIVTPTVVAPVHDNVPIVAIDPHTGPSGAPTIDSDNLAGARTATEYLIGLGHRRIAHLRGREDLESARLRELGFREAMEDAGIEVDPDLIRVGNYRPDLADAPAHELLDRPDRPTAVFAANDISAIRIVEVAHELGLRVPEDLSVIGFDNVPESASCNPPLTTIAQPLHQMGAEALRMVVDLIEGTPREHHVRLPTSLVVRASCAPPPA
ncbi:LacI family transcriptional regulator [Antribacter sp. KLBMP9083]|uniref:LacI family transcriptional regulator n=1 Tax=Antribacter soli TaxID=2910976 RepID=A0AA41QJ34_9MICO|nr:LacI family DNA-binding transcriptional regulator [Antribacter soli]MCF4123636.1 LacI family transcriptional regulator [Antribacter soli]